eukprot:tig00000073_g1737.t1
MKSCVAIGLEECERDLARLHFDMSEGAESRTRALGVDLVELATRRATDAEARAAALEVVLRSEEAAGRACALAAKAAEERARIERRRADKLAAQVAAGASARADLEGRVAELRAVVANLNGEIAQLHARLRRCPPPSKAPSPAAPSGFRRCAAGGAAEPGEACTSCHEAPAAGAPCWMFQCERHLLCDACHGSQRRLAAHYDAALGQHRQAALALAVAAASSHGLPVRPPPPFPPPPTASSSRRARARTPEPPVAIGGRGRSARRQGFRARLARAEA